MANVKYANNAVTTLASGITAVATSMTVASATAFPTLAAGEYFYCTLTDAATSLVIEIVKVTAVSGTTFTITRAQDGTTASAYLLGDNVQLRLTRANLLNFPLLNEANTFTSAQTANSWIPSSATVPTNGMYLPAINAVGFATNSAERMRIFASGGVSIGNTTDPGATNLSVTGSINGSNATIINATSNTQTTLAVQVGTGYNTTPLVNINFGSANNSSVNNNAPYLYQWGIAGTASGYGLTLSSIAYNGTTNVTSERMRVTSTGGVSIGTTTDAGATNLLVAGTITSTGGIVSTTLNNTNTITVKGSSFTLQDATDTTKQANFVLSGLTTGTTYSYTLPAVSGAALATLGNIGSTQTFAGAVSFGASFSATSGLNLTGSTGTTALFGTSATTGTTTIGGASQTGALTVGQSTVSQTTNIQAGATASGSTKTLNIGTGGLTGSTTTIAIGSTAGTSTTTINGILKQQTYTVATLPSAATSGTGAKSFVTDALAPAFGATVVTGGAVAVPVYSDGTNWKVG